MGQQRGCRGRRGTRALQSWPPATTLPGTAPWWVKRTRSCEVHVNHKEGGGVSPVVGSVVWAGSWAVFPWSVKTLSGAWHNHVALVGAKEGRHAPLTLEDYDVTEVLGYDTNRSLVYFRGSAGTHSVSPNPAPPNASLPAPRRLALKDLALPIVNSFDVALEPALHAAVTLTLPPGWSNQDDTLLYPMVVQM
ncbi:hypothetical protein E2C01_053071 [Portunus trituberculatus]|uniref:Uncharacterized protein n=1 Tax=Portunus trituberculatus TaxID=210409 RepID=A0A5B7GNG3_PORTR|nr:hypothetical protein [Portunus trituberculatus]